MDPPAIAQDVDTDIFLVTLDSFELEIKILLRHGEGLFDM